MRAAPIEERKKVLADLLRSPHDGIAFNENFSGDGATIYEHACGLGCEGIVRKRLGSPYRGGRFAHWIKVKNPDAPAVKREAEQDCAPRHAPVMRGNTLYEASRCPQLFLEGCRLFARPIH
jgi:ATP-dependent DNA ligase